MVRYYHRNLKTKNERSAVALHVTEGVAIRAKRNVQNIPDDWDDLQCSHEYFVKQRYAASTRKKIQRSQNNFRDTIRVADCDV